MRPLILTLTLLLLLPACKVLDQARWTVGTTYNPDTGGLTVEIGKSPIK